MEAYRDNYLVRAQMMRDALRVERDSSSPAAEHVQRTCRLIRRIPPPVPAPTLPSFLDDLNLWGAGKLAIIPVCPGWESVVNDAEITKSPIRRKAEALKAEMSRLPNPRLINRELSPRLEKEVEALQQKIKAAGDELESHAEKLLNELRKSAESEKDPGVILQPIHDMLDRAYQAQNEILDRLAAAPRLAARAPAKGRVVAASSQPRQPKTVLRRGGIRPRNSGPPNSSLALYEE